MRLLLVGMHFNPPAKIVLQALPSGAKVELRPEPTNPYDENAVEVWVFPDEFEEAVLKFNATELMGSGFDVDEIMRGDALRLGHIAASGKKPILKAALTVAGLQGNVEFLTAVNEKFDGEWPQFGTLAFVGEYPIVTFDDVSDAIKSLREIADDIYNVGGMTAEQRKEFDD